MMGRCAGCGAFYHPAAMNFIDEVSGGACLVCGESVYHSNWKPDPDDPFERPISKREAHKIFYGGPATAPVQWNPKTGTP